MSEESRAARTMVVYTAPDSFAFNEGFKTSQHAGFDSIEMVKREEGYTIYAIWLVDYEEGSPERFATQFGLEYKAHYEIVQNHLPKPKSKLRWFKHAWITVTEASHDAKHLSRRNIHIAVHCLQVPVTVK